MLALITSVALATTGADWSPPPLVESEVAQAQTASTPAPGAAPQLQSATVQTAPALSPPPTAARGHSWFAVSLDAGAPDGMVATLSVRPFSWIRFDVGAASNGATVGIRGGVLLSPFRTLIRPTLSAHVGHFPDADAQPALRTLSGDAALSAPFLASIGWDYASAHLGLELGRADGFSVFVRGGLSRAVVRFDGVTEFLSTAMPDSGISADGARLTVTMPSIQLGFTLFID